MHKTSRKWLNINLKTKETKAADPGGFFLRLFVNFFLAIPSNN